MTKIVLFISLTLSTLFAQNNIDIYHGYANSHDLIIEGRLLNKREKITTSKDDNWFKNIWRKIGQLINDELKNKKVSLLLDDNVYSTISDDEGYFSFDINSTKPLLEGYKKVILKTDENTQASYNIPIISTNKEYLGIISDFDDTVVVSNVPNKIKLAVNLLFKNYKQRKKVVNMAETFRIIVENNPQTVPSTLFFITGSPNQLSSSIQEYLNLHNFPKRVLITKKIHGKNPDPLFDQFTYKTKKIEKLIKLYQNMKWYFLGDSGEKDKEVYTHIAKKYPKKVKAILIRNVKTGEFEKIY